MYRYQLEKYRGRGTRYTCPKCGRKHTFTRYIDTHNNNMYINDIVGKCNRLDKCGYHYTSRQYYEDNPRLRDKECSFVHYHRKNEQVNTEHPRPVIGLRHWLMMRTMQRGHTNAYLRHLERSGG